MEFEILEDIASYCTNKISVETVDIYNYISTENMLPNIGGVTESSSLPKSGKVTEFKKGDVLFSNIRTYFKKVWLATFDGGCSNDVLVFRKKNDSIDTIFLYYILANDNFINYTGTNSKGTKMPRGDKSAIINYPIEKSFSPTQQQKIASILSSLDDKIELNNKMNQTLEKMAQTIFKEWFEEFNFPDAEDKPYKKNGGAMHSSELGEIPEGWSVEKLGETNVIIEDGDRGKNYPNGNELNKKGFCPFLNNKNIIGDYISLNKADFISKEKYETLGKGKVFIDDLVLTTRGSIGNVGLFHKYLPYEISRINSGMVVIKHNDDYDVNYLYYLLKSKQMKYQYESISSGSVQKQLPIRDLKSLLIITPSEINQDKFSKTITPMLEKIQINQQQTQTLTKLRDALLPKLMSGEVKV